MASRFFRLTSFSGCRYNLHMGKETQTGEDMNPHLPNLLTVAAAAEYLGIKPKTLYALRSQGIGPPSIRIGRSIRYSTDALQAWLQDQEEKDMARRDSRGDNKKGGRETASSEKQRRTGRN